MWNELLIDIIEIVLGAVVSVGVPYLLFLISKKVKNEQALKVVTQFNSIIMDCVTMVNQTFVDDLKKNGKFDAESQKAAFLKCEEAIYAAISEPTKQIIAGFVGDLGTYVRAKIESEVKYQKI